MEYSDTILETWENNIKESREISGGTFVIPRYHLEMMVTELRRLQSAARWVPVSERLPEENKLILLHNRISGEPVFAYLESGLHGLHWTINNKNYSVHGYSNQYTCWKYVESPQE
jgi:hypothetical protein